VSNWFDEVVEGLEPGERDRLRGVHEALVEAGPPAEFPESLATLPESVGAPAEVVPLHRNRRRVAVGALIAAALAAATFGGGYILGHGGGESALAPVRDVTMSGNGAVARLQVGSPDSGGNWPAKFTVSGLPASKGKYAYYEIFVLRRGKPGYPCAGFRVDGSTTNVEFTVPYEVKGTTRWVVTTVDHTNHWPGRIVMT